MKQNRKLIIRYYKRMKASAAYISKHPLTRNHVIKAFYRYFAFHICQLICRNNPKIHHFIDDVNFYASMGDAGIVGNIYTGLADFEEMSFLLHFLNSDDLFVDIGANVGGYSLLASGVCKSQSMAIEPIPDTFKKLLANVNLNDLTDLIECVNIGLGSKNGFLNFVETSSSVMSHVAVSNENSNTKQIVVNTLTLDSLISDKLPSLLKIDVEGFEMEVLKGAGNCLADKSCKAIIIELNGSGERYGVKDAQIHSLLMSYGFKPFRYNPFHRKITTLSENGQMGKNEIFIRDLDAVLSRINIAPKRKILSEWV